MARAKRFSPFRLEYLEQRRLLAADLLSSQSLPFSDAVDYQPNAAEIASLRDLTGSGAKDVAKSNEQALELAPLRTQRMTSSSPVVPPAQAHPPSEELWKEFLQERDWAQFLAADVDRDGQVDELGIASDGSIWLAWNTDASPQIVPWGQIPADVASQSLDVIDQNADGRLELVQSNSGSVFFAFPDFSILQGNGLAAGEDGAQANNTGDTPIQPLGDLQAIIDLDGDDSSGASDGGFTNQFTEEDGYIRLMDSDFVLNDLGEEDILELVVEPVGGVPDGSEEFLIFRRSGGVSSVRLNGSETGLFTHNAIDGTPISYQFDSNLGAVVFRRTSGEAFSTDTVRLLMDGLRYYNTDDDPDVSDRTIAIYLNDNSSVQSTIGTATISVVAVNDAPALDLDADNSSGADPVILGRDAADLTFVNESLTTVSLFNGQSISVTATSMFSSGLTATDPNFVASYFERGEAIRLGENTTASLQFDGNGVAPQGTFLFLHDVDQNESIQISSNSGTPILVEQLETVSGETTNLPTWNPVSGVLTGDAVNGVGGATILDITGVSDLTLAVGSPGTLEFGFITPGSRPINFESTFTEGQQPVPIVDSDVLAEDVDNDNLQQVVITLTNGQIDDRFVFDANNFGDLGVTVTSSTEVPLAAPGTASVTVTGPASKDNFEAALRRIEFENVSTEPNLNDRLVSFVLSDGQSQAITAETTIRIIPVEHNLSIEKDAGNVTAELGDTVVFELTVRNTGAVGASGVTITETVPTGTQFNASRSSAGWGTNGSGQLELVVGDLAPGESQVFEFALEVTDNRLTTLSNTATVSDDGAQGTETTNSDNQATDSAPIIPHTAEISGRVFIDANEDGQFNTADEPLQNVVVTLSGTSSTGNAVQRSTNTDAAGDFLFEDLPPGTYTVTETQPSGIVDGPDSTSASNVTNIGTDALQFELAVGATETVLFTERENPEVANSQISGQVFADDNNNGTRDTGESPIAGVTVSLVGTSDQGTPIDLTTTTDTEGNYLFDQLPAGSYTVTEVQPSGYQDGTDTSSSPLTTVLGTDSLRIELGEGESESIVFAEQPDPVTVNNVVGSMSKRILLAST